MPPPIFPVPPSPNTVTVRIIDTTSTICVPMPPAFPRTVPSWSFLIQHPSGRNLLFDLGLRKDWTNLAPVITSWIAQAQARVSAEKDVYQILTENGVDVSSIEAIIWSHHHFDHTGDPSAFPPSTSLLVGPGFKKAFLPGYPTSKYSPILDSDVAGREVKEVDFSASPQKCKVGRFDAIDYFSDGSFYMLDAPGHSIGHIAALARVSAHPEPERFVLMGGDVCYHAGEMRPSKYRPLPGSIAPHPFHAHSTTPCPSSLFTHLLRDGDESKAFFEVAKQEAPGSDMRLVEETLGKLVEADGDERVFVVLAHDGSVGDVVDFFPGDVSGRKEEGWGEKMRWAFLRDFKDEVVKEKL